MQTPGRVVQSQTPMFSFGREDGECQYKVDRA